MERLTHHKQLALAALLGAAMALGATPVAAQDAMEMGAAPTDQVAPSPASPATLASIAATRAPEADPQFVEGPALDNPPGPGDAFPMDQWGNTE